MLNLAASALFLIGVALLYAETGTLNLADLALRVPRVAGRRRAAGAARPRCCCSWSSASRQRCSRCTLWLPRAYAAACAPVAALFAIMTKVGVYAIVRVHGVVFGPEAGDAALVAAPWLAPAALAAALLGVVGALAAPTLGRMAAYLTVASVGTLLIAVGAFSPTALGAALFYLPHSSLAVATLFLVVGQIGVRRGPVGDRLEQSAPMAQSALLGALFVLAAIALIGLPPLAGFAGKVMILRSTAALPGAAVVWTVILVAGFLSLVGLMRAGSLLFWNTAPVAAPATTPRRSELVPPLALVACGIALAMFAEPVKRYTDAAARQLGDRGGYATAVLGGAAPATTRPYPAGARP